jgi:parallel beta-helix repeat protein
MSVFGKSGRRVRGRDRDRTTRLGVELFEDRTLLSAQTFQVTDAGDNGSNTNPTVNTLRWAIQQAEVPANAGSTIDFDITTGSSPFTINLTTTALLPISQQTTIDGTSEPGYTNTPIVVINGSALASGSGLDLTANGSVVRGLDIVGFAGTGAAAIEVASNSNIIAANYLGVATNGTAAGPGNATGVSITGSNNSIGGTTATANSIAFNTGDAVDVDTGTGNSIRLNAIFGNGGGIVLTSGGNNNQAAPTVTAVASVPNLTTIDYGISGTVGQSYTVDFYASSSLGGPAARYLGSVTTPALISGTQNFTATFNLATPVATGQNVTATATSTTNDTSAFATAEGLASPFVVTNTTDNVPGSEVGSLRVAILDANSSPPSSGTDPITFSLPGVSPFVIILTAALPTIGVPVTIDGTTASGVVQVNGGGQSFDGLVLGSGSGGSTIKGLNVSNFNGAGIRIESAGDTIADNLIGTDPGGTAAGPGNRFGILVDNAADAVIGGTAAGTANTIGFNTSAGISISGSGATGNQVIGNFVGTDPSGNSLANLLGISISSANNFVGGTATADANIIGFNFSAGVSIGGTGATGNQVLGNFIGTDSSGRHLGNIVGISISAASNFVGQAGAANLVDFNASAGVSISGSGATGNQVIGNFIGTDSTGDNRGNAVGISAAGSGNTIGGTATNSGNVIGFNTAVGVSIGGTGTVGDVLIGNFIGTDSGGLALGNLVGVSISSSGNEVGGANAGDANTIGYNNVLGISVLSGSANTISQNLYRGTNGPNPNAPANDIGLAANANNNQPAPTITSVSYNPSTDQLLLGVYESSTTAPTQAVTLEIYLNDTTSTPPQRVFVTSTLVNNLSIDPNNPTQVNLTVPGLTTQSSIIATLTDPTNGTSAFSGVSTPPSPYVVNNTSNDPNVPNSLPAVIAFANQTPPPSGTEITFNIPISQSTSLPLTITLNAGLDVTNSYTIDGTTQPGFDGTPVIQISGGGANIDGFVLMSPGTIKGLEIVDFGNAGIHIESTGNTIVGNEIGVSTANGSSTNAGNGTGIFIDGSQGGGGASIGGTTSAASNIVGFNTVGISITGSNNAVQGNFIGTDETDTQDLGNSIGIDVTQDGSGNSIGGPIVSSAPSGLNASSDFRPGNIIGWSTEAGIIIEPAAGQPNNVTVMGNLIGTDLAGNKIASNVSGVAGIWLKGAAESIGGTNTFSVPNSLTALTGSLALTTLEGNVIGFATGAAISITGGTADSQNSITGNFLGVDPINPKISLTNGLGVEVDSSSQSNLIGGPALYATYPGTASPQVNPTSQANVIGFSRSAGVSINGSANNLIRANFIGTEPGTFNLGNAIGIVIDGATATGNTVGGQVATSATLTGTIADPTSISGNIIAFSASSGPSGGDGILLSDSTADLVAGNYIGTDPEGDALGNVNGIEIDGSSSINIGSTGAAGRNIIAANSTDGILVDGSGSNHNVIIANVIGSAGNTIFGSASGIANGTGLDSSVTSIAGNFNGIDVESGDDNSIGGAATPNSSTGAVGSLGPVANTITGNLADGVLLQAPAAGNSISGDLISQNSHNGIELQGGDGVTIDDNLIGTDIHGLTTDDDTHTGPQANLGNLLSGIQVSGTVSATIKGNIVSGNGLSGITLEDGASPSAGAPVLVQDNLIGTDINGTAVAGPQTTGSLPLGNVLDGIRISTFQNVMIGSTPAAGAVDLDLGTSGGNVISGNLGRGVEVDASSGVQIGANLIGVVFGSIVHPDQSKQYVYSSISTVDVNGNSSGNLADGIFVLSSSVASATNTVVGDVISGNRGYGVHVSSGVSLTPYPTALTISGDFIGTDQDGLEAVVGGLNPGSLQGDGASFGNGADGIFLDNVSGVPASSPLSVSGNVISGNHANGIDILDATQGLVSIVGNRIGTDADGGGTLGSPRDDFGNAADGILLNGSNQITVGGTVGGSSNVVAGNHGSGVFVSASAGDEAQSNSILGNYIGVSPSGPGQSTVIPNAVAGIILSNANDNSIGGTSASDANVISGNSLDGILLVNNAIGNLIASNDIGTDPTGVGTVPNSADGILLLGTSSSNLSIPGVQFNPNGSSVSSNTIQENLISGNNENGIQIFGTGASNNVILSNTIGLGVHGVSTLIGGGNKGNGVYLNNDGGGNVVGELDSPNVISGNGQSGVLIYGTATVTGSTAAGGNDVIQWNDIGTDSLGDRALANAGNGVFIYGTSKNQILNNVISGNAQAGVTIFSPTLDTVALGNLIAGNKIGTNAAGTSSTGSDSQPLGNRSDGIDVYSGQDNTIGSPSLPNVISGNLGNGIFIAQLSIVSPNANTIAGNDIGIGSDGATALPNGQNGILVQSGVNNQIGVRGTTALSGTEVAAEASNVISANGGAGIQITGTASNTLVQANYIGTRANGMGGLSNGFAGVFINNLGIGHSSDTIGGSLPGEGNLIDGSYGGSNPSGVTGFGVDILGPAVQGVSASNVVQGNLIGLDAAGNIAGSSVGVYIQNSSGNLIGGAVGNVISGNTQAGVELTGLFATQNTIQGNEVGTSIGGAGRPGVANPLDFSDFRTLQQYGVYITTPSSSLSSGVPNNQVLGNVISGNLIGVNITGVGSATGTNQNVPIGQDVIASNKIGTDPSGYSPNPNFEYGVYINNSAANTVGGSGSSGNVLSANGVDGVEIFGGTTQTSSSSSKSGAAAGRNVIVGNHIGVNPSGGSGFTRGGAPLQVPDGPMITLGEQLYGVVVIGSSSNLIGSKGVGNTIGGNVQAGVYITRQDFQGNIYSVPTNNNISSNSIINNGIYGVYRFEAPGNSVAMGRERHANKFRGNAINLADYIKTLNSNTQLPRLKSKFAHKKHPGKVKPAHADRRTAHNVTHAHSEASHPARPRIPALFLPGVNTRVIEHIRSHRGH